MRLYIDDSVVEYLLDKMKPWSDTWLIGVYSQVFWSVDVELNGEHPKWESELLDNAVKNPGSQTVDMFSSNPWG
ncbi:hypothetical protein [Kutzneria buriramensis]|uniref:Uncharacterized protein n=1 Tax=Kutzneria buriramensis TaxID=1045776 RepID=A0A3E0G4N9_9PSEU|nr:hypothetical protein [Kutzneria buriramensis]REH17433.1 hypothetical protein BCF44_1475 [Kutzneria buriramensis]